MHTHPSTNAEYRDVIVARTKMDGDAGSSNQGWFDEKIKQSREILAVCCDGHKIDLRKKTAAQMGDEAAGKSP
ncbi:MAG: hypothetical protein JXJ20_08610 [Anaerolineae bacterium]|nr:hypothetical protein [Anaerolineae bacterium]